MKYTINSKKCNKDLAYYNRLMKSKSPKVILNLVLDNLLVSLLFSALTRKLNFFFILKKNELEYNFLK